MIFEFVVFYFLQKAQSNGHVVTIENLSPSARQQAAKATPQAPKAEKGEQPKAKVSTEPSHVNDVPMATQAEFTYSSTRQLTCHLGFIFCWCCKISCCFGHILLPT